MTKNVPPGSLRLRKNLVKKDKRYVECYRQETCRALANSVQARQAHRNADSLLLIAAMVFQTCVYPELNCSSCFFEPRTNTISPGLLSLRWDERRHQDFGSIKQLPQYQEHLKKSGPSHAVDEPLSRSYVPKRDPADPKDACWRHPKDKGKYKRW